MLHVRNYALAVLFLIQHTGFSWAVAPDAEPADSQPAPVSGLSKYTTKRLVVYTDLSPSAAEALLQRLERVLGHAARYWGRQPERRICCYVIDDLEQLSSTAIPHRLGRVFVGGVSGATVGGNEQDGRRQRSVATVYASTAPGVAEHEIVHAYCSQNYGSTGPYWYKEGMAEMVVMGSRRETGLRCAPEQMEKLRLLAPCGVAETLAAGKSAEALRESMSAMLADPKNANATVPESDWSETDRAYVAECRADNLKCWLFCYFLLHNKNYSDRFREFGPVILSSQNAFRDLIGPYQRELEFEYAFLLQHLRPGLRVDLCSWDWKTPVQPLDRSGSIKARVRAAQGYQSSGLLLVEGQRYAYRSQGSWATSPASGNTTADGDSEGRGQLVGVIMNNYQLCEPFLLGADGTFTAPCDGALFLRCDDDWTELADNHGTVSVTFRYEFR